MPAQIGLGAAAALTAPFVVLGAFGVLLLMALLTLWLLVAAIRTWNIAHDTAAPSFRPASHANRSTPGPLRARGAVPDGWRLPTDPGNPESSV